MSNYNPYAAPQHDGQLAGLTHGNVTWDGKHLVIPKQYSFPRICLKCASREVHSRRTQKFAFTPMWARMMVIFCWIGAVVAMAITTKRATLELPLCDPCHAKWKTARNVALFGGLGLVALIIGAVVLAGNLGEEAGLLAVPVTVLVGAVGYVVLVRKVTLPATLQTTKIDETYITLAGVEPRAAQYIAGGGV